MSLQYVYGIVPASAAAAIDAARIEGIDGTAVHAVVAGRLAAVVGAVSEDEYDSHTLNERVRDLEWLTPRAAEHQAVNSRLLELAPAVLPVSFGALYRDEARVREMLQEDAAARAARLDGLAGRGEWVVTVSRQVETTAGADAELRALDEEIARATPGKAFLLERRRTKTAAAATERADDEAARRVLERLAVVSERIYREPVPRGGDDVVALRVSLLAPLAGATDVERAVEALRAELGPSGYHVRTSGPWPAYRFGTLP